MKLSETLKRFWHRKFFKVIETIKSQLESMEETGGCYIKYSWKPIHVDFYIRDTDYYFSVEFMTYLKTLEDSLSNAYIRDMDFMAGRPYTLLESIGDNRDIKPL